MNLAKLIKDRSSGAIQVRVVNNISFEMMYILEKLGLARRPDWLEEIDEQQGIEILETILWKHLGYNDEIMERTTARRHAEEFISSFVEPECRLYSNGKWQNFRKSSVFSFNSMTEAMYNAGVVIIHPQYAAMLWVEDES